MKTNTDKIRELAEKLKDFANRMDKLDLADDTYLLIDDSYRVVVGGYEDDKNPTFYLHTEDQETLWEKNNAATKLKTECMVCRCTREQEVDVAEGLLLCPHCDTAREMSEEEKAELKKLEAL